MARIRAPLAEREVYGTLHFQPPQVIRFGPIMGRTEAITLRVMPGLRNARGRYCYRRVPPKTPPLARIRAPLAEREVYGTLHFQPPQVIRFGPIMGVQ